MALDFTAIANDLVWAFGLVGADGRALTIPEARNAKATARASAELEQALGRVRPVATAPSVGEIVASLRGLPSGSPPRMRRRLVAELDALVAQGTHRRVKRQERKRVLGELVIVLGLEHALGIRPDPAATDGARIEAVARAAAAILDR